MASINLIDSFQEFKDAENIDRPTLMKVMEDVFKTLIRKKYGSDGLTRRRLRVRPLRLSRRPSHPGMRNATQSYWSGI